MAREETEKGFWTDLALTAVSADCRAPLPYQTIFATKSLGHSSKNPHVSYMQTSWNYPPIME